ncbi:hypothetical protein [Streptomyces sp. NPDC001380]|uniref:hypothetical protein n=1 Tax=Streptomyces sp. NPDC001380 TaxID=3364566 RepID=UPI0036CB4C07
MIEESPRPQVPSAPAEVDASPVFVDRTGRRGRRLRGLGWVVGVVCVGFAVAMIAGLVGVQSQAPSFAVPDTANTTPPSQYVNAPLPSPPRGTRPRPGRVPAGGPGPAAGPAGAAGGATGGSGTLAGAGAGTTTGTTTGAGTAAGTGTATTAGTTAGTAAGGSAGAPAGGGTAAGGSAGTAHAAGGGAAGGTTTGTVRTPRGGAAGGTTTTTNPGAAPSAAVPPQNP